ncbi:flagellar basal body P-ring formation chaperone FlgA [Pseudodesulfovibrio sp.]|uniref:flagellar basal body P-ring formation chaperone FlgA n=1 Tax=Pseudodesulfovibrio sp. TaxID=2035812 RepID=UPI00260D0165|nr:flagellar basal body P-ring formation chaperone FlgA [Pseudodesulfovibrio sp.]MDD3312327.1 flagellar basal body P-ring formation chaperone FlgA [Pseudodesulfovibrio sp.]
MPSGKSGRKGPVRAVVMAAMAVCLLVAGTVAAMGASVPDGWKAAVRSVACVQGPTVLLGEIADPVQGADQRTWRTLSQIALWKASDKRGHPVSIDRDRLAKVLRHYMGDEASHLVLPMQLTVQTGGKVLNANQLRSEVVEFLTPRSRGLGDQVEMKDLDLPDHYFFDNVTDTLTIEVNGDVRPGRNTIRLRTVNSQGKVVAGKAGTVFLNVWKAVPVAAAPLNRGERVTRDKVGFRRVNLAYNPGLWDGVGGPWRMVRTLGRGQPFMLSHLEPVPVIEKGERVDLVYRGKRVQLTMKVEALEDASMGQQIQVRNLQSKKTVVATVVGDDLVMVR